MSDLTDYVTAWTEDNLAYLTDKGVDTTDFNVCKRKYFAWLSKLEELFEPDLLKLFISKPLEQLRLEPLWKQEEMDTAIPGWSNFWT